MDGESIAEPGFLVRSVCGREWFVPRSAIRQDYIDFLIEQDRLSPEAAAAKIDDDPDFVVTWFSEQCASWPDIDRMGKLVKKSTLFKTKAAMDKRRRNSCVEYEEIDNASNPYPELSSGRLLHVNAIGEPFFDEDGVVIKVSPEDGGREFVCAVTDFNVSKLSDYFSANSLLAKWEDENGALKIGYFLTPIIPFVLGGEFLVSNLHAIRAAAAAVFYKDIRSQISGLPDGAQVELRETN